MTEAQLETLSTTLFQARCGVLLLAVVLLALGGGLLHRKAGPVVRALPRARITGMALSTLCWVWVACELISHPVDLLAFLTPLTTVVLAVICAVLSIVLLENLLCARAIGGLMMLWPMPLFLLVRDQVTAWRLVPVVIGYASLTLGMVTVFYPWRFRVAMDWLAERPNARRALGALLLLAGVASLITLLHLGKVVGE